MKVSEPAPVYGSSDLQGLKNRLIATIDTSTDERKLKQCWELLQGSDMPCVYTDEELDRLIKFAEIEGFASQEEVDEMFARWRR